MTRWHCKALIIGENEIRPAAMLPSGRRGEEKTSRQRSEAESGKRVFQKISRVISIRTLK
jgi:hypothetical protein